MSSAHSMTMLYLCPTHSIYFLGCLGTYFERFFRGVCCGICVCAGCTYKDKPFPANASSIGAWNKLPPNQIEWCGKVAMAAVAAAASQQRYPL